MIKLTKCYIVIEFWKNSGITNIGGVYMNAFDAEEYANFLQDEMERKGTNDVEYSVIERPLHPRNWDKIKATYYGWD